MWMMQFSSWLEADGEGFWCFLALQMSDMLSVSEHGVNLGAWQSHLQLHNDLNWFGRVCLLCLLLGYSVDASNKVESFNKVHFYHTEIEISYKVQSTNDKCHYPIYRVYIKKLVLSVTQ